MITAWLLYATVVGALLGAAGLALEAFLRTHGLPSRWIWVGTIILSVAWPVGHWAWDQIPNEFPPIQEARAPAPAQPSPVEPLLSLDPVVVEVSSASVLRRLDGPIVWAWAGLTGILLCFFFALFLRTRHLKRGWRGGMAGGHAVLFSDKWGPAVVGIIHPRIVLPRWCQDLDERSLRLILDHELEHVRAGDLRLIILAGIFPILVPLHLPLWWQLARLRTAIEGDCDLRVLGRNPGHTRPYVDLLLNVGQRYSQRRPVAVMLSEPYETLKRRIRIMTMPIPKRPWTKGAFLAGGGLVLVALAGWAPGPIDAKAELEAQGQPGAPDIEANQEFPVFTPYTVWPAIGNREEVVQTLEGAYPPLLQDAGIGGEVQVWYFVNEEGEVRRTQVNVSSGHKALDDTAIRIANIIEFTPALSRDQRMPVWISVPVIFTTDPDLEVDRVASRWPALPSVEPVPSGGETAEVSGRIMDESTGQPLASVQVFVLGTGRGTLTNAEGRFVIKGVPVGDRHVVAQLIGFAQGVQEIEVSPDGGAEADFSLEPEAMTVVPVVVKGCKPPMVCRTRHPLKGRGSGGGIEILPGDAEAGGP